MAIRNKPIYQALALILLGATLIVWSGCGSDDNPIVTEDTPDDDSPPAIDDPAPVILTGSLKGQVEGACIPIGDRGKNGRKGRMVFFLRSETESPRPSSFPSIPSRNYA